MTPLACLKLSDVCQLRLKMKVEVATMVWMLPSPLTSLGLILPAAVYTPALWSFRPH